MFLTRRISGHVNTVKPTCAFSLQVFGRMSGMHSVSFYLVFVGRMNALRQTLMSPHNETIAVLLKPRVGLREHHQYIK